MTEQKLNSKDIVALFTIGAVLVYKITGHNGSFDALLMLIVGYYFARRSEPDHNPPTNP